MAKRLGIFAANKLTREETEAAFRALDHEDLVECATMWRMRVVRLQARTPSRRLLQIARELEELQDSAAMKRILDVVADLPSLSVSSITRRFRHYVHSLAVEAGFIDLDDAHETMLLQIIASRDDDDNESDEAVPDRPRTPATVE